MKEGPLTDGENPVTKIKQHETLVRVNWEVPSLLNSGNTVS